MLFAENFASNDTKFSLVPFISGYSHFFAFNNQTNASLAQPHHMATERLDKDLDSVSSNA